MDFELIDEIRDVQSVAVGRGIRELARLRRRYGRGRWRKLKGIARVRLIDGTIHTLRYVGTKLTVSDGRKSR
jgi:hypothetical protein